MNDFSMYSLSTGRSAKVCNPTPAQSPAKTFSAWDESTLAARMAADARREGNMSRVPQSMSAQDLRKLESRAVARAKILNVMQSGKHHTRAVSEAAGVDEVTTRQTLIALMDEGLVTRTEFKRKAGVGTCRGFEWAIAAMSQPPDAKVGEI